MYRHVTRVLNRFVRLFPRSSISRSIGVLASGAALGQVIVVITSPIITRIYSPNDLGALAVYSSILSLFGVIASLRYEQAIPVAEERQVAASTLILALLLIALSSLVALSAALVAWRFLPTDGNLSELRPLLWLLPIGVIGVGVYQALSMWAIRHKAFTRLAGTSWRQGVSSAALQIGLGILGFGASGLVIGLVVGQSAGVGSLAGLLTRGEGGPFPAVRKHDVISAARRFRRFPLFSAWSGLLYAASFSLPVALMAYLFGPLVTGFYSLGLRALQAPLRTLGNAVSQVYFSASPEAARAGRLAALTTPALEKLIAVGMPASVVITLAGADISALIFGADWREAGVYMQWLTPWLFLTTVTSPVAPLFTALELQRAGMYFNGVFLLGRSAALVLGGYLSGPVMAVAMFSISSVLIQASMLFWLSTAAGVPSRIILTTLFRAFVGFAPFALPLLVIPRVVSQPVSGVLILVYGGAVAAVATAAALRNQAA